MSRVNSAAASTSNQRMALTQPPIDHRRRNAGEASRARNEGLGVAAAARADRVRPAGATTRVCFDEKTDSGLAVLTVETSDRPGLLLAITRALHRARVQILGSEATTKDGHVVDRFTLVELDGAPLRSSRRGVLQVEVLAAIDSLGR